MGERAARSSAAVLVFHAGRVAGCINVVTLRSALTLSEARRKDLAPLHAAARKIEGYLDQA